MFEDAVAIAAMKKAGAVAYVPKSMATRRLAQTIRAVARTIYGAAEASFSRNAVRDLDRARDLGFAGLPICIAKTQSSLSDDPSQVGRPSGFVLHVDQVRIAAGAGYLLPLTGDIVTMPGLPKRPHALDVDLSDDGEIIGIG